MSEPRRVAVKGRTSGWPGVVEALDYGDDILVCPTCGVPTHGKFAIFDHVAAQHPLLVKGESAQR